MTQTGFQGLKAWLVAQILRSGSRVLYGKRLPQLLASLSEGVYAGTASSPAPESPECMTKRQGLLRRLLRRLNPKRMR